MPTVAFFTSQRIEPFTELLFDYGKVWWPVPSSYSNARWLNRASVPVCRPRLRQQWTQAAPSPGRHPGGPPPGTATHHRHMKCILLTQHCRDHPTSTRLHTLRYCDSANGDVVCFASRPEGHLRVNPTLIATSLRERRHDLRVILKARTHTRTHARTHAAAHSHSPFALCCGTVAILGGRTPRS
jgi:hypothetical protein